MTCSIGEVDAQLEAVARAYHALAHTGADAAE
jgi:hypothetical protein